jgi:hypothetical protein
LIERKHLNLREPDSTRDPAFFIDLRHASDYSRGVNWMIANSARCAIFSFAIRIQHDPIGGFIRWLMKPIGWIITGD